MKRIHRAGLAGAAALVIAGMLPVQVAFADWPETGLSGAECPVGNGAQWFDWGTQPLVVNSGDGEAMCRVAVNVGSKGAKNVKLGLTLSAESVAASGYSPELLGRMIAVQVSYLPSTPGAAGSTAAGQWVVNGDGSLTLDLPPHDVSGDLMPAAVYDFHFSVAPAVKSVLLKGQLELSADGLASQSVRPVSLSYVGDGHNVDFAAKSTFVPLTPARLLDTRSGIGAAKGKVGPDSSLTLQVAGRGGVPATGVSAVVMNVTATNPTAGGYVTVYPHGQARPVASNLNFTASETIPNQVTVPVVDGKIDLYNRFGTVDLVADISGYYTPGTSGSRFTGLDLPARLLDTRSGIGAAKGKVGPDSSLTLQVAGRGGVPATGVSAVVLNVTATNPTAGGYVTVYPHGQARPVASNLNFTASETIPNQVTVPVVDGKIDLYNRFGTVDLIADISGYYSADGSVFVPTGPTRVLDTRNGTGGFQGAIPGGHGIVVNLASWDYGVPRYGATGSVLNVTATGPTAASFLTVQGVNMLSPSQQAATTSSLNFSAGETIANAVTTGGGDGASIFNHAGRVDVVADLAGYFMKN